ncbi:MAG: peroxiredoxin family protein [Pyrinomonadaceae bacterium]|nr:peroxiredoxin family protein [Pyrinomonadaceae bacterium]
MKWKNCLLLILFSLCVLMPEIRAANFEIGAKFPVEKLITEKKVSDNKLIVFMPSLTYDCDYASMLTQSFYYYFDQKLAFEDLAKSPQTEIFLVVNDKQNAAVSTQNIFGKMNVIYDEKGEIFASFGITLPKDKNADATVFLLDSNEIIALIDKNYRAQGEHLKPLENKLKELNGIYKKAISPDEVKPLKTGKLAPDFQIDRQTKLSDLRGNVVLLSFYPAAFSGTLPKPVEALKVPIFSNKANSMSCAFQIDGIDDIKNSKNEAKRIVISSSTASLLEKWKNVLGTHNVEYANDPDYSISQKYFSYNPNGYNNRVSVIIDKKGKIAYIDESFDFDDEKVLNKKIYQLLKK